MHRDLEARERGKVLYVPKPFKSSFDEMTSDFPAYKFY